MSLKLSSAMYALWARMALACALFVGTLMLFWPTREYDFIKYDDPLYVTENEIVQRGLTAEGFRYAFTTGHASNWHPITWLSHMMDCELSPHESGRVEDKTTTALNPAVHHTTSIVLHAINAALLFLVLCSLVKGHVIASAFVAAFFAVHPLRIESVVWISERKDLLSLLFGLLAIWLYASFVRGGHWWKYALLVVCFALSLMSKPMLVTLPFVLLLLDFWPLKRIGMTEEWPDHGGRMHAVDEPPGWTVAIARKLIIEKIPLFALAITSSAITVAVQRAGGSLEDTAILSLGDRLSNAAIASMRYLGKTIWPADLAVLYPYHDWPVWMALASLAGLIVVTALAMGAARRLPALIVGWLWFVGALVPVIGLVQVGAQSMADRYTYFPHIGLFIAIVFTAMNVFGRERAVILAIAGLGLLFTLGYEARRAMPVWRNSRTLYEQALRVTNDNWVMHQNLGDLQLRSGELSQARENFERAADIQPRSSSPQLGLAELAIRTGDVPGAISRYKKALELLPGDPGVMNNLAWMLATQADPTLRDPHEALRLAKRANELTHGTEMGILDTLAAAHASAGEFGDAIATAEKALAIAVEKNELAFATVIRQRIALFRAGQPIREGVR